MPPGSSVLKKPAKKLGKQFLEKLSEWKDDAVAQIGDTPVFQGQPASANIPGVGKVDIGGSKKIQESAQAHAESQGRQYLPQKEHAKLDPKMGEETAEAYAAMKHDPTNPEVHRAYQDLADETVAMYERMLSDGIEPYFIGAKDPYAASPYLSILDISQNKKLGVFPTESGFGGDATFDPTGNPLLQPSGFFIDGKPALINDLFRAIHDYYGHAARGFGFRAGGERNAFLEHFASLGPLARRAAATETHGQNSSLNFGPNGSVNRTAGIDATIFENQKTGLMSNDIIMAGTELQNVRQRAIESVLRGDERGLEAVLGKDGSLELVHYSKKPLDVVDPKYQGTGLGKKTISEVNRLSDTRAPKRSSFGIENVDQPYKREQGLGQIKNKVRIKAAQMYDLVNDPNDLKATIDPKEYGSPQELATLLERAVKENGYSGFFVKHPTLGAVAQIFDPIKTVGKKIATIMVPVATVGGGSALGILGDMATAEKADAAIIPTIAQQGAKTFGKKFSGANVTLGGKEAAETFGRMHRPNKLFSDRALYGMGYLTDESILKHASDPKKMEKYIAGREKQLLNDLKTNPGLASKYDLMAANDFQDVFKKLARVKTPVKAPEELEGDVLMATMSDLSATVETEMIGGIPGKAKHQGGTGFTSIEENVAEDIGWAANVGTMNTFSRQMDEVAEETGKNIQVFPVDMVDTSVNFISPLAKLLVEQSKEIKIPKSIKNSFDRAFRKQYPQWVGLDDPRAAEQMGGLKTLTDVDLIPPEGRKLFARMMASGNVQRLGFPSYLNAVKVLSKPGFMEREFGQGQKFFSPKPGGPEQNVLLGINNDTYSGGLLIDDFAKFSDTVPAHILFKDEYEKIAKEMTKGKVPRKLTPEEIVVAIRTRKDLYQEATPEWVENVSNYLAGKAKSKKGQEGFSTVKFQAMLASLIGGLSLAASDPAEGSVFTSLLTAAVKNLPMKKGSPDQMVNMIKKGKGLSAKEMDLIDWNKISGKKSITKEELGEFVEAERPKINIVEQKDVAPNYSKSQAMDLWYDYGLLTADDWINQMHIDDRVKMHSDMEKYLTTVGKESIEEATRMIRESGTTDLNVPNRLIDELTTKVADHNPAWLEENLPDWTPDMGSDGMEEGMRYKGYSIAGGENYREIYFNLEGDDNVKYEAELLGKKKVFDDEESANKWLGEYASKLWDDGNVNKEAYARQGIDSKEGFIGEVDKISFVQEIQPGNVSVGHMSDQPNNMAWARVTEHTGPNGEKVLQINEIQSDARNNEQLKKALPKEWKKNVMHSVMKQAKDEGFDGVTWAKDAKQVDEIEKWNSFTNYNVPYVVDKQGNKIQEVVEPGYTYESMDELVGIYKKELEDVTDRIKKRERQQARLVEEHGEEVGNRYADDPSFGLMNKDSAKFYTERASELAKRIEDLADHKSKGYEIKTISEDVFRGSKGQDRVVSQYTEEMPQYAKEITGQDVQSITVGGAAGPKPKKATGYEILDEIQDILEPTIEGKAGYDLNYVPVQDVDIPDPVFFGKPTKAAAVAAGVGGAGTGTVSADEVIAPSPEPVPGAPTEPKQITLGQQMFPETTPEIDALAETLKTAEAKGENLTKAVEKFADLSIKDKKRQQQADPAAAAVDDSLFNQMLNAPDQAAEYIEKQTGIPFREIAGDIYEVVSGDKRRAALPEDVRNLSEIGKIGEGVGSGSLEGDLKIAYGRLFGNDEELRGVIEEQGGKFIDHQVGEGETVTEVILPTGARYLLNAPGASGADSTPIIGEAIQYAGPIKAVSMAKPLGVAAQTGIGMGLFGASDVARQKGMQAIGSQQDYDPWDTAINSLFGAYPAAPKLVNPIKEAYRKATGTIYNPIQ